MERIIMHIDVNNAFLSWTAVDLLNKGYKNDIREEYSVIGGDESQNESMDCYILLIVMNHNHLNHLMDLCSTWHCQYNKPNGETGNVPTYRISISNLNDVLDKLNLIDENYIF